MSGKKRSRRNGDSGRCPDCEFGIRRKVLFRSVGKERNPLPLASVLEYASGSKELRTRHPLRWVAEINERKGGERNPASAAWAEALVGGTFANRLRANRNTLRKTRPTIAQATPSGKKQTQGFENRPPYVRSLERGGVKSLNLSANDRRAVLGVSALEFGSYACR